MQQDATLVETLNTLSTDSGPACRVMASVIENDRDIYRDHIVSSIYSQFVSHTKHAIIANQRSEQEFSALARHVCRQVICDRPIRLCHPRSNRAPSGAQSEIKGRMFVDTPALSR